MTQTQAEILLFASLAINAALLVFLAGVLHKVMNEMDESAFKQFVVSLVRHSKRSALMIVGLNLPFLGAIPYFYVFGFRNRWLCAGLALWFIAGSIGKVMKLPIYKAIETGDDARLTEERHKLHTGNLLQAILNTAAMALAAVPLMR